VWIKKTVLATSAVHAQRVIAINILEGDELLDAMLTDGNCEIMMAVKSGRRLLPRRKVRPTAAVHWSWRHEDDATMR